MFLRLIIVAIIAYMNDKNNKSNLDTILEDAQSTKKQLRSSSKKEKDHALKEASDSINSNRERSEAHV